jgi:hypothetical protein
MLNHPTPLSDSHDDILHRLIRRVQTHQVEEQILRLLKHAFEVEIEKEMQVLSRRERVRLLREVAQTIMRDALGKLGG